MNNQDYNDEIDLIDLIKTLFKWKLFIGLLVALSLTAAGLYIHTRPNTYTASAEISIGKIAGQSIDGETEIELFVNSLNNKNNTPVKAAANTRNPDRSVRLSLTAEALEPGQANNDLNFIINEFMKRQQDIYTESIQVFEKHNRVSDEAFSNPVVFIKSFTYPSRIISQQPAKNPENKKIILKMTVTFFGSLFGAIFMVFFLEFSLNLYRQYRDRGRN